MRVAAVGLIVFLAGLGAGAVQANYVSYGWFQSVDYDLPASPCGPHPLQTASSSPFTVPTSDDAEIWMHYRCGDGREYMRRFGPRVTTGGIEPFPDQPASDLAAACAAINMVAGITGGCVTPDHPLAKRR